MADPSTLAWIQQLRVLLGKSPPPEPQGQGAEAPESSAKPRFDARMSGLLSRVESAVTGGSGAGEAFQAKAAAGAALAEGGDFEGALRVLDELDEQLEAEAQRLVGERVLAANARDAFAEYLSVRDTSGSAEAISQALGRAEAQGQAWQDAVRDGPGDDALMRDKAALHRRKLALEREALNVTLARLAGLDALLARRDAETDAARLASLQAELIEARQTLLG